MLVCLGETEIICKELGKRVLSLEEELMSRYPRKSPFEKSAREEENVASIT